MSTYQISKSYMNTCLVSTSYHKYFVILTSKRNPPIISSWIQFLQVICTGLWPGACVYVNIYFYWTCTTEHAPWNIKWPHNYTNCYRASHQCSKMQLNMLIKKLYIAKKNLTVCLDTCGDLHSQYCHFFLVFEDSENTVRIRGRALEQQTLLVNYLLQPECVLLHGGLI